MATRPEKPSPQWTNLKLLVWATDYLRSRQIDSPRSTAEILLSHALGGERIDLYIQHDKPLGLAELAAFKVLLKRRIQREPVAYIVGSKSFWTLDLMVTPEVLIPRPETECLVETVLERTGKLRVTLKRPLRILDLGTGTGAIVLSLASEQPENHYFAADISPAAVHMASVNAGRAKPPLKVHFFVSDWFQSIFSSDQGFDVIVSNPPYIRRPDIQSLEPEICRYEPLVALDGGSSGLDCHKKIIENAHHYLPTHGLLAMEIGFDQKKDIMDIVNHCGHYENMTFFKDYSGHDRIVQVQKR